MRWPTLLLSVALCLHVGSCTTQKQLVLGFATDLQSPGALDHVSLRVFDDSNSSLLTQDWDLPGELTHDIRLPGSFALDRGAHAPSVVEVELTGSRAGVALLKRTSAVAFPEDDTLFFRMALVQRCEGITCPEGQGCIEGKCRPQLTNAVSILPYRAGMEASLACNSGSTFVDTTTGAPMPTSGDGCAADQWCGEATCYGDQGQTLLWCTPPSSTCTGIDGYESCLIAACDPQLSGCYGSDWRRGQFGGPCRSYAECRRACGCDASCVSGCDAARSPSCGACLVGSGGVTGCLATADAGCTLPTCRAK